MAGEGIELAQGIFQNAHTLATEVVNRFVQWNTQRDSWKERVADTTNFVYAESTRDTSNGANFDNSTHRPKISQIYENLVANYVSGLMPHKRWLRLENETKKSFENKEQRVAVLSYLVTKHRLSGFTSVIWDLVDDWVLYGNAFAMVYYTNERGSEDNPWSQYELNYKGPRVRRISPFDIVFNPLASSFEKSPKIIRTITTMAELIKDAQDNPDDLWKMDVVEQLRKERTQLKGIEPEDLNKAVQMKIDGFGSMSSYLESGSVEVLDLYGDIYDSTTDTLYRNHVITVVDRRLVVRNAPLKNWTGKPRIHHTGWRKRKDNLWAMGPLDNIVGLQFRINHLENGKADAFDEMLHGDLVISGSVDVTYNPDGSKTYVLGEGGNINRLAPDTTVLNADLQIPQLEAAMELYAGSPREASGFRTPGEKTKFEVSVLTNAASRIFQHKMTKFEVEMMEQIINSELMVAHQGMQTTDEVRNDDTGDNVPDFISVSKDDLLINGRVVPIGARHYARQAQLAGDLTNFSNILQTDAELKQHFSSVNLGRLWENVLDVDEYQLYEAYVRIDEAVESQRRIKTADKTLKEESNAGSPFDIPPEDIPAEVTP